MALPTKLEAKIVQFREDASACERFREALRAASIPDIVDPALRPAVFGPEFVEKVAGRPVAYPLLHDEHRVGFLSDKIAMAARGETDTPVHPASAYLHISIYQEQFRKAHEAVLRRKDSKRAVGSGRRVASGSGKKKAAAARRKKPEPAPRLTAAQKRDLAADALFLDLEKLKKRLHVPLSFSRARDLGHLRDLVLDEFDHLASDYVRKDAEVAALRAEVLVYRNPDYMHADLRRTMDESVAENIRQKLALNREALRAETLEQEVQKLAEQILSAPGRVPSTTEEIELLRRDHNVLSDKYDTLVSKNIELINRLERAQNTVSLEVILDTLREKINGALRAGVQSTDDVLLRRIQEELIQLVRARSYLGRALYDMGLLYLRLGRRPDAVRELRAARELGVEDPETNRLLNS